MLTHDSGEACERSETDDQQDVGSACERQDGKQVVRGSNTLALRCHLVTLRKATALLPLSQQADNSPKLLGEHQEKRKCDGVYINTEVLI